MNGHIEEGALQAWLDGELSPGEARATRDHLEGCSLCREYLEELEALAEGASRALSLLEPPAPDLNAALWEVRRRRARRRSAGHRRGLAAAAVVVLLLGAGAAVALPGSPFRSWIEMRSSGEMAPAALDGTAAEDTPLSTLGVTVDLLEGAIDVVFQGVPPGMVLELEPVKEDRVGVYAPPASRFRTAPGRVEVTVNGAGEVLRVRVPEGAARAEIRVNHEVVARVVEGDLVLPGAASRSALEGRIRVRLSEGDLPPGRP